MRRYLPRTAAGAAIALGLAIAVPAAGQNALDDAAVLQQKLDLSALSAHAAAQLVKGRLNLAQAVALKDLGRKFGHTGNQATLMQGWQVYLAANRPPAGDINSLIALVMREAYLQASADLKHYAEKARHINEQKAKIREEAKGSGSGAPSGTFHLNPGLLQLQMKPTGDDAQLADIDLQNATQRQQQTLQTMANIAKAMHDTAMAVIRKLQ